MPPPDVRADEDDELASDIGTGAASGVGAESELGGLLLDLGAGLWRLSVLLSEAPAEAWDDHGARIARVLALCDGLPREPRRRRRAVGFGPDGLLPRSREARHRDRPASGRPRRHKK